LPADDEWHSRYIVAEEMADVLGNINPRFPEITGEEREKLEEAIRKLENE
jgi:hypothetical protein